MRRIGIVIALLFLRRARSQLQCTEISAALAASSRASQLVLIHLQNVLTSIFRVFSSGTSYNTWSQPLFPTAAEGWQTVRHGWDGHVMVIAGAEGATPAERAIPYPLLQPWMKLSAMLRCRTTISLSPRGHYQRGLSVWADTCARRLPQYHTAHCLNLLQLNALLSAEHLPVSPQEGELDGGIPLLRGGGRCAAHLPHLAGAAGAPPGGPPAGHAAAGVVLFFLRGIYI